MRGGPAGSILLALLAGCAALPPDPRPRVRERVDGRLGVGTSLGLDEEARGALAALLEDGVLEPDEAVRLAVGNNARLRALLGELDVARADLWRASLPPNPVVDAELRFLEGGAGDLFELVAAQSIVDVLLIPRRRGVQRERLAEVEAEVTGAVVDLATEVRAAYRRLQAQAELVGLYRSATDATFLSFDAARRLREAGNVTELEVLQEQAMYEEAKVALVEARTRERAHREGLNALLGIWGPEGEAWTVEPRLPDPVPLGFGAEELERRVLATSLDLEAMRHSIVALGQRVGLERLEVSFEEATLGAKAEREADETWSVGPVGSLSLPVFRFGQAAGARGRARLEQAYERYTDLAVRIRRSARRAYVESEASANNVRYLREVVLPLRSRITGRTQLQYNAMQLGVFQLLEARRQELAAGRRYVETLRDHWLARARLEALLLGRLPRERFGISGPDPAPEPAVAAALAPDATDGGRR